MDPCPFKLALVPMVRFQNCKQASFMAEKLGFGVVDAMIKAFDDSG
jgi:hypothetical protein